MNCAKRICHLLYSIKNSVVSIVFGTLLIVSVAIAYFFIDFLSESQFYSFISGIVASVVATLVLRIADCYQNSVRAHTKLLSIANRFDLYFDLVIENYSLECESKRFQLWLYYNELCGESLNLVYKKDYYVLSKVLYDMVDSFKPETDVKTLRIL